jgi:SHS family lactate transporter-like MFS transporter
MAGATVEPASLRVLWTNLRAAPQDTFLICLLAYTLSQLDLALFAYAVPSIRKDLGISLGAMGVVVGVSYALGGVLMVWLANLTDRLGRKTMLVWGTVAASLTVAATSLVPNAAALTLVRGLGIAAGGLSYPATGALVTEEAPARIRGLMAGLLQTGYPIGWFAAAMFAAPFLTYFGWRALFLVALAWIPYAWVIRRTLRESNRFTAASTAAPGLTMGAALRTLFSAAYRRRVIALFAAQFLFVIAYGGTSIFFPTYFVEDRHLQVGSSAYLVGIGNAIGVLGYVLAAITGELWLTRRNTVVLWTWLGAASFLVLVWGTESFAGSIAAFAVMSMFFYGTAAVKFAYIAEVFPTPLRATGLAFCGSLAVNFGIALGPMLVTAAVARFGWDLAFSLVGAIPLAAAGLLYFLLKPIPSGLDVEETAARA